MIVLGLDPGSRYFGYAILDSVDGVVESGQWRLGKKPHLQIFSDLSRVIAARSPRLAIVELPFVHRAHRFDTVIALSQARGAALVALEHAGITYEDVPAASIKKVIAGNGNADKDMVREAVKRITGFEAKSYDESDAISAALYAWHK